MELTEIPYKALAQSSLSDPEGLATQESNTIVGSLTSVYSLPPSYYNWMFTLTQNNKQNTIEDLFKVLSYINKTRHLELDTLYNLEVAPKTGCLHVHIRARIPKNHRRILFKSYKYNLPDRIRKYHPGYYFYPEQIMNEDHNKNITNYDKGVNNLQSAKLYVIQGYAEGWFARCPYHSCGTCNDFTIYEAFNYYIYSIWQKLLY